LAFGQVGEKNYGKDCTQFSILCIYMTWLSWKLFIIQEIYT